MSTDTEFLDGAQRSAERALAAMVAAHTEGVTAEQLEEISEMAKRFCDGMIVARETQARARALGFQPVLTDPFASARKLAAVPAENPGTAGNMPRRYPGLPQAA